MAQRGEFSLQRLLPSLKVRVTAIHHHDDRLYVGTAAGQVRIYSFEVPHGEIKPVVKLLKTHSLSRKPVDQVEVLPNEQKLVVLSDSSVTLYTLEDVAKPRVLSPARSAHTLATATNGSRDVLVVGCRKKVIVYGAGKGGIKEAWELSLPHSPRLVLLTSSQAPRTAHLLYSTTTSALLHIESDSTPHLYVSDIDAGHSQHGPERTSSLSEPQGGGGTGISMSKGVSALSGLGGYVGLGGKSASPVGTRTVEGEVLVGRDDSGTFLSSDGNSTRSSSLSWPAPPESVLFSNPFIYSIVPHITAPSSSTSTSALPTCLVQIHLAPTLHPQQSLVIPVPSAGGLTAGNLCRIEPSGSTLASAVAPSTKCLFVSSPLDKTLATNEGSTIWTIEAGDLGDMVDQLVEDGRVSDAISLVESVGETGFTPDRRLPHLKPLRAVQEFAQGQYQSAMETFVSFNVNSALVISLYPADKISGRLHVPRESWMALFGAVDGALLEPKPVLATEATKGPLSRISQVAKRTSIDSLRGSEKDVTSPAVNDAVLPRAAFEALMYFLSDRRQKLNAPMATTTVPPESSLAPLSSLAPETLHALPSVPFTELDPETLLRMAQVVYTALIKVYLVARPILVGSLCRIENWCDVEEVEELLKDQKKFSDLIDLYQGKKMHKKALGMLHDLAMDEEDKLDRYPPTIEYLQKLGPSELPLILETSKWIFSEDSVMGLKIFTADKAGVEALPRMEVMRFLDGIDETSCVGYLEHIIDDLGETRAEFHDRLAELYLKKVAEEGGKDRLLEFLNRSTHYRPYRLLQRLTQDLPEVRAILLGRQGRHEDALRIYVYTLKDYAAAEGYCIKVYASEPDPKGIFLLLLRLYLRPSASDPILLEPALRLIGTHGTRLDAEAVLDLLPPLVTMKDVEAFFVKTLRDGHAKKNDARIVKQLVTGRKEQVERVLMDLQVHRVRVTDQRICPQCHKRLGQSAIAVHAPRGEVTHLHCKDSFGAMLAQIRA